MTGDGPHPEEVLLFVGKERASDPADLAVPGDPTSARWALRAVRAVTVDAAADRTLVELETELGSALPTVASADAPPAGYSNTVTGVPVVNARCDMHAPLQALADSLAGRGLPRCATLVAEAAEVYARRGLSA